jgi:hypothetical protein
MCNAPVEDSVFNDFQIWFSSPAVSSVIALPCELGELAIFLDLVRQSKITDAFEWLRQESASNTFLRKICQFLFRQQSDETLNEHPCHISVVKKGLRDELKSDSDCRSSFFYLGLAAACLKVFVQVG